MRDVCQTAPNLHRALPAPGNRTLTRMLRRIARALWRRLPRLRRFVLFSGPVAKPEDGNLECLGCRLVPMTLHNFRLAARFRNADIVEQLGDRLRRGARGWFAVLGDDVAGYGMLHAPRGKSELVRRVLVHPGEAAATLFYVRRHLRGRGIATALLKDVEAQAVAIAGVHTIVTWTVPSNVASRTVQGRAGLLPAGRLWILEILGKPVLRRCSGSPVER